MNRMSAAVLHGPGNLKIESVPLPRPGPKDVLLRIEACGVCGSDARAVFDGDRFSHIARIPGHEPTGIVVETGDQVQHWHEGDFVALAADIHCGHCFYCRRDLFNLCEHHQILGKHLDGALAEYMLLPARVLSHGIVTTIPPGLTARDAALSEPLCSVLASHDELRIQPGENVVVIGCGPMGVLHLLLLQRRGARVLLVGRSQGRLEIAKRFGPDEIVSSEDTNLHEAVSEFTGQIGADVVICSAPSPAAVQQAPSLARRRGRIGLFAGLPRQSACVSLDINRIHYAEQHLVGNFSYHPRYHRAALAVLEQGAIDCDALITTYPLTSTEQALHDIRAGRVMKAVVQPGSH